MDFKNLLIGIVLIGLLTLGTGYIVNSFNTAYNTDADTKFTKVYDTLNETSALADKQKNTLFGKGETLTGIGIIDTLVLGAYRVVIMITSSFTIIGDILKAIASEMGIPVFWITGALTILSLAVVFALVYLILRYKA